ncbi:transporter [Neolewinella lacunae]|nr:transporter [Neolewinella lacunae]MDN3634170.1 transporter [Neolewinella lacunae]
MRKIYYLLLLAAGATSYLSAQTPSDAILMKGNQACVLLEYSFASFDHYWEGEVKRNNQTIETVHRRSAMPMVAIGLWDNLNIYAGVPYVKTWSTEPNGGNFAGASGLQDLTLAAKYRWLNKTLNKGELVGLATLGFSTPISNYLPDYQPYSIGIGAPELSYRAILEYQHSSKWFVRGAGAYLWRGYAEAEREYYYNDGSYYTPWMDVPSAFTLEAVAGKWFLADALRVQLSYIASRSLSGDDIRSYNAPQPTNRVNFGRVGLMAQYYFPQVKGLGVVAYHNRIVDGRNAPEMITTGLGLTYFFNYRK